MVTQFFRRLSRVTMSPREASCSGMNSIRGASSGRPSRRSAATSASCAASTSMNTACEHWSATRRRRSLARKKVCPRSVGCGRQRCCFAGARVKGAYAGKLPARGSTCTWSTTRSSTRSRRVQNRAEGSSSSKMFTWSGGMLYLSYSACSRWTVFFLSSRPFSFRISSSSSQNSFPGSTSSRKGRRYPSRSATAAISAGGARSRATRNTVCLSGL
mmetsp:Transcript_284/g.421  ORF Transcript_284/g.421 Transcript_284/m.421 type:complete len:215 (-) Transcript_284:782-1426(-)